MKQLFLSAALLVIGFSNAQIGIGTNSPNISAALDITSTTQGLLPPRMTNSQMIAIATPTPAGMQVWCTDCGTSGELRVNDGTAWITFLPAPSTVAIGLHPELGGYVFYVSTDGLHGLVAETLDQGNSTWYGAQNLISDPASHTTDGKKFTDWRLPTLNELTLMHSIYTSIRYLSIYEYWSSTEFDSIAAYVVSLFIGDNYESLMSNTNSVRAVRAF